MSYTMFDFICGLLSQGADVDSKNMDSPFRALMQKYTCYNHTILKQKFPDLDIIRINYLITITYDDDSDTELDDDYYIEYEEGSICVALPKDIEGNIEDINPKEINITSTSEKKKCSYEWTVRSIKYMN